MTQPAVYYHTFLKEQPDVNWRNRDVRAAMQEVIRFWLKQAPTASAST